MEKNKSLIGNLSWQTAYQVIAALMPLITSPYLSRVLGASQIGVFSSTSSLALFFRMFAMLGNVHYGTREMSKLRNDREERSVVFKETLVIQITATIAASLMYLGYALCFNYNGTITWIQTIWILECLINIGWLYDGVEDFKYTALLGVGIKFFQLCSILLFVKEGQHVVRYAFIMSISTVLYNIALFAGINRLVDLKAHVRIKDIAKRLKPILILFVPEASVSVFRLMSKLVLGEVSGDVQSGYYYCSDHLVNIPMLIITGLCTVMLSRMSIESKDKERHERLFRAYSEIILAAAVAFAFGIWAISKEFIPFFFGDEFIPCIKLTYLFCPILLIKSFSSVMNTMVLLPQEKDKVYGRALMTGAAVSIAANGVLTAGLGLGALGAALSTLIAEFSVVLVELIMMRDEFNGWAAAISVIPYIIIGGIMTVVVRTIAKVAASAGIGALISILVEIVSGALCFCVLTFTYLTISKRLKSIKEAVLND